MARGAEVRCFWLQELPLVRVSLRAMHFQELCPKKKSLACRRVVLIGDREAVYGEDRVLKQIEREEFDESQWIKQCGWCSRDLDYTCVDQERLYQRADTGEIMTLDDAPIGAIYEGHWYADHWIGPDGRCICVRLPDGQDWIIDSRASNCGWKKPTDPKHNCWKRAGDPPKLSVTKGPCPSGGGGSIKTDKYHGHLVNGVLREC